MFIYGLIWEGNEKLGDFRVKIHSTKDAFNPILFCFLFFVPKPCYSVYSTQNNFFFLALMV